MRIDEFSEEFTKLYRFFKDKDPNDEKVSEYYELLQFLRFDRFKHICKIIKENEDRMPGNIVAYCNNLNRESGEKAVSSNNPTDAKEKIECAACQDTGFIAIIGCIDPDTKKRIRKVKEPSDRGIDFAFRCLCSKGQQLSICIPFAKEEEVKQSAIMNEFDKPFQPKQNKAQKFEYEEPLF